MPTNKGQKSPKRPLIFYYAVTLIVLMLLNWLFFPSLLSRQVTEVGYDELVSMVDDGKVETVSYDSQDHEIVFEAKDDKGKTALYKTGIFPDDALVDRLLKGNVKFAAEIPTQASPLVSMLVSYIVPIVLIIAVGQWLQKKMMKNMGGNMMSFGKSGAKIYAENETGKTFADVAGQDEAKEALTEIVDFLHNPNRYAAIGAKLPKGALLVGPPGTGKTLLAKAVAGEAGVKFLSISGSDFVEMYVGVGASRVRDLFHQAKQNSPAIVFIDEIDAVGRQRGSGLGGGHDEREQTLNQLLVEMDGFAANQGVVVLAATNRVDILDPALLRPGRFDRQVYVGLPDIKGRQEILAVHAKNKPLAEDVDLEKLAKGTSGFTGADLENLLNEAALLAGRRDEKAITMADLQQSVIKVIAGPEKHSRVIPEHERRLTAYHEAGHAVVMHTLPDLDPVHQITIVPRGQAGGMTIFLPDEDRSYLSRTHLLNSIAGLLGGRAAEQLVLGDISTGASNDISRATQLARKMVGTYGMSDRMGSVAFDAGHDEVFIGRSMAQTRPYSEETAAEMDREIRRILDEAYGRCTEILEKYRPQLTEVAEFLLQHETMTAQEFEQIFASKDKK